MSHSLYDISCKLTLAPIEGCLHYFVSDVRTGGEVCGAGEAERWYDVSIEANLTVGK